MDALLGFDDCSCDESEWSVLTRTPVDRSAVMRASTVKENVAIGIDCLDLGHSNLSPTPVKSEILAQEYEYEQEKENPIQTSASNLEFTPGKTRLSRESVQALRMKFLAEDEETKQIQNSRTPVPPSTEKNKKSQSPRRPRSARKPLGERHVNVPVLMTVTAAATTQSQEPNEVVEEEVLTPMPTPTIANTHTQGTMSAISLAMRQATPAAVMQRPKVSFADNLEDHRSPSPYPDSSPSASPALSNNATSSSSKLYEEGQERDNEIEGSKRDDSQMIYHDGCDAGVSLSRPRMTGEYDRNRCMWNGVSRGRPRRRGETTSNNTERALSAPPTVPVRRAHAYTPHEDNDINTIDYFKKKQDEELNREFEKESDKSLSQSFAEETLTSLVDYLDLDANVAFKRHEVIQPNVVARRWAARDYAELNPSSICCNSDKITTTAIDLGHQRKVVTFEEKYGLPTDDSFEVENNNNSDILENNDMNYIWNEQNKHNQYMQRRDGDEKGKEWNMFEESSHPFEYPISTDYHNHYQGHNDIDNEDEDDVDSNNVFPGDITSTSILTQDSELITVATTVSLDPDYDPAYDDGEDGDSINNDLKLQSIARLLVEPKRRKRSTNSSGGVKEIILRGPKGRSSSVTLSFGNNRHIVQKMRLEAFQVRFEETPGVVASNSNEHTTTQTVVPNAFSLSCERLIITPGNCEIITITFNPQNNGVYTGVLKVRCSSKSFVLLLRGECLRDASQEPVTYSDTINDSGTSSSSMDSNDMSNDTTFPQNNADNSDTDDKLCMEKPAWELVASPMDATFRKRVGQLPEQDVALNWPCTQPDFDDMYHNIGDNSHDMCSSNDNDECGDARDNPDNGLLNDSTQYGLDELVWTQPISGLIDPLILQQKWVHGWLQEARHRGYAISDSHTNVGEKVCESDGDSLCGDDEQIYYNPANDIYDNSNIGGFLYVTPRRLKLTQSHRINHNSEHGYNNGRGLGHGYMHLSGSIIVRSKAGGEMKLGVATSSTSIEVDQLNYTILPRGIIRINISAVYRPFSNVNTPLPPALTDEKQEKREQSITDEWKSMHLGYIMISNDLGEEFVCEVSRPTTASLLTKLPTSPAFIPESTSLTGPRRVMQCDDSYSDSTLFDDGSDLEKSTSSSASASASFVCGGVYGEDQDDKQSDNQNKADDKSIGISVGATRVEVDKDDGNSIEEEEEEDEDEDAFPVSFNTDHINFGQVDINTLNKQKLIFQNNSNSDVKIRAADPILPFVLLQNEITIMPSTCGILAIRFLPVHAKQYKTSINIEIVRKPKKNKKQEGQPKSHLLCVPLMGISK
jgi:hypothetical protein